MFFRMESSKYNDGIFWSTPTCKGEQDRLDLPLWITEKNENNAS